MTPRLALAASHYGDPWSEVDVLAARIAGALVGWADVEVLLPDTAGEGRPPCRDRDGAVGLRWFPATAPDRSRRWPWRIAAALGADLPSVVEDQVILAEAPDSPALIHHLTTVAYDAVVLVGFNTPIVRAASQVVPDHCRVVVVPGVRDDAALSFECHRATLARADRILVSSTGERAALAPFLLQPDERIADIGVLTGVNPLARAGDRPTERPAIVVPGDWTAAHPSPALLRQADRLEAEYPELRVRLVGPGAEWHPRGQRTTSRLDVWRAMRAASAVWDPTPDRVLGLPVLEAMLLGTPVLVPADGGASVEHAEAGAAGLSYRSDAQLVSAAGPLLDPAHGSTSGRSGEHYATRFTDTERWIDSVGAAVQAVMN